jgi:hypothetical protein
LDHPPLGNNSCRTAGKYWSRIAVFTLHAYYFEPQRLVSKEVHAS